MKRIVYLTILVLIVIPAVFCFPDTFSYQGRVFSPPGSGTPIADSPGNTVQVRFYDALTGGVLLWTSPSYNDVQSKDGYFTVNIGGWASILTDYDDIWIEIDFNGETMAPRQELLPSPFSGKAVFANNVLAYPKSIIWGPQSITSTTLNGATLSVTNTAGTGVVGFTEGINDGAGVAGYSYTNGANSVGVYGYGEFSDGVMGQSMYTPGSAVYGEHLNGGIGVAGKGMTGVAAITEDFNGMGLYVNNTGGGNPMTVQGGNHAYFNGPGVLIDSASYPAALFVSFTAGAWPAAIINAPNGQALEINGSGGGLGNPVLDVKGMTDFGTVTAIHGYGGTDFGQGGAGVSGTAKNGTGVYAQGITGVAAVADGPGGVALHALGGSSLFEGMVTVTAITPGGGSLNIYNNAGTGEAIRAMNSAGTSILSMGDIGVRGEGSLSGVEGIATGGGANALVAQNSYSAGLSSGSALAVKGKIAVSGSGPIPSPLGVATVQAGSSSVNVINDLCLGGSYRVLVTPVSSTTDGAGNPISWWVDKQDGNFNINIISQAATSSDITFDFLIINNGL